MEAILATALRIKERRTGAKSKTAQDPAKAYLERLIKLVPAEVVALYLAGTAAIKATFPHPENPPVFTLEEQYFWLGWTAFCLVAVVVVRAWATSSKPDGIAPEWRAVTIAAVSFVIWVYSLGDVFVPIGWWKPLLATLAVLGWTFAVPLFYRETLPASDATATKSLRHAASPFSEAHAEQSVLASAERLTNRRPSLSDTVSGYFDSENRVRRLLGRIQDHIVDQHGIWVELAESSSADVQTIGEGTFHGLSSWVLDKVSAG